MINIKEMKAKSMAMEPMVRIGKSGVSESVIGEIKKQLHKDGMIKIKMLKSFIGTKDRKEVVKEIVEKTNSQLVLSVGFIIVLARK